ncbi:hypothetical protein F383_12306 [Gossypium arboreum]|uniref:Uncharacterized protein n=1 Tax=Gossypium arboreum TaxID=29729 RepID=A0A0B0PW77_GOSAR|nr:hypothetical protein F383_12306 [Gossypium arboreum]
MYVASSGPLPAPIHLRLEIT